MMDASLVADNDDIEAAVGKPEAHHGVRGASTGQNRPVSMMNVQSVHDAEEYTAREKVRLLTLKPGVQLAIVICAFVDILLLFIQLGSPNMDTPTAGMLIITWAVLGVYIAEIILRIYAYYPKLFFTKWFNLFDFFIVALSLILLLVENDKAAKAVAGARGIRSLFMFAKTLRAARVLAVGRRQASHGLQHAARNITGENKKRYVDLKHSIDIDLTYINTQIIAMGVPATGLVAIYRNPIGQMVKFFNLRHKDKYWIYNVCPELPYDHAKFDNRVRAFDVQDHTPPNMNIIMEFLEDAGKFVQTGDDHVIAVHCRGGKGRTGTLVCSWLLFSQFCDGSEAALVHFATARTELRKGSKTLQGVDTPSQKRYVRSVHSWLAGNKCYLGSGIPVPKPPVTKLRLKNVKISKIFQDAAHIAEKHGSLVAAVHINGEGGGKIVKVSPALDAAAIASNELEFDLQGVECGGDLRISFFEEEELKVAVEKGYVLADSEELRSPADQELTKRKIAGKEPGVLFYFLFHSAFVSKETCSLEVPTTMMDKAFKPKNLKKKYNAEAVTTLYVDFV